VYLYILRVCRPVSSGLHSDMIVVCWLVSHCSWV